MSIGANIVTPLGLIYLDSKGYPNGYKPNDGVSISEIEKLITRVDLKDLLDYRYFKKMVAWDNIDDEYFDLKEVCYWDGNQNYIIANRK